MDPLRAPVETGRLGSYELLAELASGGMATVYVARQMGVRGIERLVVVKRVHPHLLRLPKFREMFQDEARLSSLVRHPNVVPLLDVLDLAGELVIVFEYVESVSLATLLREARARGARLPLAVTGRILVDVLAGLHAAHDAKDVRGRHLAIVHRDLSPQNIIVGVDGVSHLIDFGIAKAESRLSETTGGALKGKLAYMSPEQAQAKELDRRSDLFSAGVVLFEAVTGRRPFDESSDGSHLLLRILLDPVAEPSSLVDGVPVLLDAVVARALERVRDERFQTAAEFEEALIAAVPPASARAVSEEVERWCGTAIARRREELQQILRTLASSASRPPSPAARRARAVSRPLVVATAAALCGTVAVAIALSRSDAKPRAAAPAQAKADGPVVVSEPAPAVPFTAQSVVPTAPPSAVPSASRAVSRQPAASRPTAPRAPVTRQPLTSATATTSAAADLHQENPY
jgi:serine/threonine-protein kinase